MSYFATEGDVLGYEDYYEGDDFQTVGAPAGFARMPALKGAPRGVAPMRPAMTFARGRPQAIVTPPKPAWRNQLAPGVPYPGERLQPLPLTPNLGGGIFTAAIQNITFSARPQVPFKGERLVATVRRTGAAGVLILATSFLVGTKLQVVQNGSFDLEFFSPTAFGVRYSLDACEPGVDIVLNCSAGPAVAGTDTVAVSIILIGRSVT